MTLIHSRASMTVAGEMSAIDLTNTWLSFYTLKAIVSPATLPIALISRDL